MNADDRFVRPLACVLARAGGLVDNPARRWLSQKLRRHPDHALAEPGPPSHGARADANVRLPRGGHRPYGVLGAGAGRRPHCGAPARPSAYGAPQHRPRRALD